MSLKFKLGFLLLLLFLLIAFLFISYSQAQTNSLTVDVYGRILPYKQINTYNPTTGLLAPSKLDGELTALNSGLFDPYVTYAAGDWDEAVGVGDFNNDAFDDVAISEDDFSGGLRIFLQNTGGTLDSPVLYNPGSRPASLAIGDLNNDGRDDVVVANLSDNTIGVFLQQSDGTLAAEVTYSTNTGPDTVAVADLNNDNRDDVVVAHWSANNIGVFLQQSDGTLASITSYPAPQAGYDDIDTGDLNNDGLIDVVKMNGQGLNPNLSVYLQNLSGTLDGPTSYDLPGNILSNGVAAGDVTGDGLVDLTVSYGGNRPSSKIAVFAQTVTGTLSLTATYDAYDIPEPIEVADINRDGRLDVLVAHGGWVRLGVFLQQNDGTLAPYELYNIPYASHYGPQGLDVGKINNDCSLDVVIADYNYGLVVLYNSDHTYCIYLPLLIKGLRQKVF